MSPSVLLVTTALATIVGAAGSALAADVSAPAPAGTFVVQAPGSGSWQGLYVGGHLATLSSADNWSDPTGILTNAANTPSFPVGSSGIGVGAGVVAGYNYQWDDFVVGAEAGYDLIDAYGHTPCGGVFGVGGTAWTCTTSNHGLGTLTARAGFATENTLLYLKGGLAYAPQSASVGAYGVQAGGVGPLLATQVSSTRQALGWTLGLGLEYALTNNWSLKAEYDYVNLGRFAFSGTDPTFGATYGATVAQHENFLKLGLNYYLGGVGYAAAPFATGIAGEVGVRAGVADGRFQKTLYDPVTAGQMNSRLTWPGLKGGAGEVFARIDDDSGFFAKGFVGGLAMTSSSMTDEDFPPALTPYSNTSASTSHGRGLYATLDSGYNVFSDAGWQVGPFLGYNHFEEAINAYGCTQQATNTVVCAPAIPGSVLGLSETSSWDSLRLGLNGVAMLTDQIKLTLDAAWLPYTRLSGTDNHWLRPDIDPLSETGHGSRSYQLEGELAYLMSNGVSVGVGGRYWSFSAPDGSTTFPGNGPSPLKTTLSHESVFLQLSYAFGTPTPASAPAPIKASY